MFDSLNTENVLSPEYSMWHPHPPYGEWPKSVQPPKPTAEAGGAQRHWGLAHFCSAPSSACRRQPSARLRMCLKKNLSLPGAPTFCTVHEAREKELIYVFWKTLTTEKDIPLLFIFPPATFVTLQFPAWFWPYRVRGDTGSGPTGDHTI